jgi:rhodanese-related sulfurtransferase
MHASLSGSAEDKSLNIMERLPEFIVNHLFLVSLLVAISSLLFWNLFFSAMGSSQIVPAEVTRLINHEDAAVLDIRTANDFENGHIINAVNIDVATLGEREKELEKYKDKPVVIYCGQGQESIRVARSLKTKGFEKLYSLKGGISAWQNASLPLTKGKS